MQAPRSTLARGVVAGVIGATALALWFLLSDLRHGQPFRTPAFLGSIVGLENLQPGLLPVVLYTLIHYTAFAAAGAFVAWAATRLEASNPLLTGLVIGLGLFVSVLYGSAILVGFGVMRELGWAPVLFGNIAAGLAMAAALRRMNVIREADWLALFARSSMLREGLTIGLIGAAAVAAWFFIVDTAAGHVLFTPAALGSAIFLGARSTAEVQVTASVVLGYSALHVLVFVLVGMAAARLAAAAEDARYVLLGAALAFVTLQALAIGLLAIVSAWLVGTLAWWNIAIANLVAVAAMGAYLYASHPDLVHDFRNVESDLAQR